MYVATCTATEMCLRFVDLWRKIHLVEKVHVPVPNGMQQIIGSAAARHRYAGRSMPWAAWALLAHAGLEGETNTYDGRTFGGRINHFRHNLGELRSDTARATFYCRR